MSLIPGVWPWEQQPPFLAIPNPAIPWLGLWIGTLEQDLVTRTGVLVSQSGVAMEPAARGRAWSMPGGTNHGLFLLPGDQLPTQGCTIIIAGARIGSDERGHFGESSGVLAQRLGGNMPYTPDGKTYWDFGGATEGATRLSVAGLVFDDADVFGYTTGPRGMEIWQNGILRAANSANATRTASAASVAWGLGGNNDYAQTTNRGSARWYAVGFVRSQLSGELLARLTASQASFYATALAPLTVDAMVSSGIAGLAFNPLRGAFNAIKGFFS